MTLAAIDTGRTIGAAPSTAAFVRDQLGRGVSAETLRRRLKIRPENMIDMINGPAYTPPLPKARLATRVNAAPDAFMRRAADRSGSLAEQRERMRRHRAEAEVLIPRILDVVSDLFRVPATRLMQTGNSGELSAARAAVFGLAVELRPDLTLEAISHAMQRKASAAHDGKYRCAGFREKFRWFDRKYLSALARLQK